LHPQDKSWSLKRISEFGYLRVYATRNVLNAEVSILHGKLWSLIEQLNGLSKED